MVSETAVGGAVGDLVGWWVGGCIGWWVGGWLHGWLVAWLVGCVVDGEGQELRGWAELHAPNQNPPSPPTQRERGQQVGRIID